jgi:hypothetical protein
MAYLVEHIRYTLECDACGLIEKRDLAATEEVRGADGWSEVRTPAMSCFCCPGCLKKVSDVLLHRAREVKAAKDLAESTCEHDYQLRGLLAQCTKCKRWR